MLKFAPSPNLIQRTSVVAALIFALLAASYIWRKNSEAKLNSITERPMLLDEVVANPSAVKGRMVTTICYLWPGMEGLGLSTMPARNRWRFNDESKRNETLGTDMLAKCDPEWDKGMPSDYFDDINSSGDKLVVVQGFVFDSGYGTAGQILEKAPYFRVVSCRMLREIIVKPSVVSTH